MDRTLLESIVMKLVSIKSHKDIKTIMLTLEYKNQWIMDLIQEN